MKSEYAIQNPAAKAHLKKKVSLYIKVCHQSQIDLASKDIEETKSKFQKLELEFIDRSNRENILQEQNINQPTVSF